MHLPKLWLFGAWQKHVMIQMATCLLAANPHQGVAPLVVTVAPSVEEVAVTRALAMKPLPKGAGRHVGPLVGKPS